jgi:hypothetical protein
LDDLIQEILLRVTPQRCEALIRCSAVCKAWRRLLTSAAFLRRYRDFHGTASLLGFLFNHYLPDLESLVVPQFVHVTTFRPRARDRLDWFALDARHGRVLLHIIGSRDQERALVVWDPVTGEEWHMPMPDFDFRDWDATVLCAAHATGCNHLHCRGGPFLVAFVGNLGGMASACVYSSEAGAWGDATTADNTGADTSVDMCPAELVGNALYFLSSQRATLVEYDLGRQKLAFINTPFTEDNAVVMPWEGGRLGFAAVPWQSSTLHLWSRDARPDGTAAWSERRVIDLKAVPPLNEPWSSHHDHAVCFAEGLGVVFISTSAGIFALNLESGRIKKVLSQELYTIIPYTSFCTPGNL